MLQSARTRSYGRFARPSFCLVLALFVARVGNASPARPAPPLAPPSGAVVTVSTEAQLQAAMGALTSNTTIVLAPGRYELSRTLYFNRALTNVGIRGATGNSEDVVLIGPGMTESNYGSAPFGIWTGNGVDGITIAHLTIRDF